MKIFIQLTFIHFFLISPLLLFGAGKMEFKKATATKSRMDRVWPNYASFETIQKVLKVLEYKTICKHPVDKEYIFTTQLDARLGQTQQGIRVNIEKGRLLQLQTEFGLIHITTNNRVRFNDIITKISSDDTPIFFQGSNGEKCENASYNIQAIGSQNMPQAQVAIKYLPASRLYCLWEDYSKKAQQSNVVASRKKGDRLELAENKNDEEDGWVVVRLEK